MNEEKHNGIIAIWKFIFCIVIAIYHIKSFFPDDSIVLFKGGYIAVEFFFIVLGFYFAKNVLKKGEYKKETIGKETVSYIWSRIKKIFKYVLIIYVLNVVINIIKNGNEGINVNSIWNLLLLKEFGFRSPIMISATWFLSVIYVSMFILYPFLKKYRENFILLISPIISIFLLGYLSKKYIGLDHAYHIWDNYINTGLIRCFAEINIGMIIYYINQRCKNINYTFIGKFLLTITSQALLIGVLVIITLVDNHAEYDYIMLLMIAISVLIMTSGKTLEYKLFSNKVFLFLEKISIPIYLNHQFFRKIINAFPVFNIFEPRSKMIIYLTLTIIFSILEYLLISKIDKAKIDNFKKIFIE